MRSTDLYPTWTMATTGTTDPRLSRLVTRVLLEIAPIGEDGLYWGVATDYTPVDQLFRDLRIGPYDYLRHWTMERVVREYWPWLLIALMVLVGLLLHGVRVTQLVRVRAAELKDALKGDDIEKIKAAQEKLMTEAQKIGQALYAQQGAEGAAGAADSGSANNGGEDDVVDAEVVDDDEKDNN